MISASSRKETTNTGVYTIDPDGSGDGVSEETGWLG